MSCRSRAGRGDRPAKVNLILQRPLATAISAAFLGIASVGGFSSHAVAADNIAQATRSFQISAGPLGSALTAFAAQAGISVTATPELVKGVQTAGVQGSMNVPDALSRLLAGSGLEAVAQGNGVFVLRRLPSGQAVLPEVKVSARQASLQDEGWASDGYRVKTISSLGPLGSMSLLDTPFSISVIPQDLIKNIQAQSPDDIYKLNPSTRTLTAQGTGWTPVVSIRGFQTSDVAEDGLRRSSNHAAVIEDKERVEILSGLSGFLYGAAPPAGMINYVYKRPTIERLNSVTLGNYGGGQYYVHGDFGGRIDEEGRVGYRLNLVRQDGNTAVDDQKIDRTLISAALDWKVTDKLLLETNAVYNNYKTDAASAYWFYGNAIPRGKAPDASKNWSQPWIHDEFENAKLTGRLTYQVNDRVTLRGGYTRNWVDRPVQDHTMNSMASSTTYRQLRQRSGQTKSVEDASQALADFKFETGSVAHTLTVGYYGTSQKFWGTTYAPHTGYQGPYPLDNPTHVPEFAFPANTTEPYYSGRSRNDNYVIGDNIVFDSQWAAMVGINRSQINSESLNAAGAKTQDDYDKARTSPTASLMFKPVPTVTTYVSYIEGLERGGTAPTVGVTNPNQIMPPMISKQKEIGVKAEVGRMLLTSAVFEIEKAYEYNNGVTYTQDGRQNHKGVEFGATGKPTDRWTVVSGLTFLDPSIHGGANDGKEPMNVANSLAKVYSEYDVPGVPGLTLNGGVYYTGKQWANAINSSRLPSYTTVDLGIRYATRMAGKPLTLRVYANNVADRNYWLNSYYVGAPRSIGFSAQLQF